LKQENSRLLTILQEIEERHRKEEELQKQRTLTLQNEIHQNLQHRQKLVANTHPSGRDQSADIQLVISLTELVRDKNERIAVLEEVPSYPM
jgi:hypothetical protein